MYHFLSGFTSKVREPSVGDHAAADVSTCFGAALMPTGGPRFTAKLLAAKNRAATARAAGWSIPGWTAAPGTGKRMPIRATRAFLAGGGFGWCARRAEFRRDPNFGSRCRVAVDGS